MFERGWEGTRRKRRKGEDERWREKGKKWERKSEGRRRRER